MLFALQIVGGTQVIHVPLASLTYPPGNNFYSFFKKQVMSPLPSEHKLITSSFVSSLGIVHMKCDKKNYTV